MAYPYGLLPWIEQRFIKLDAATGTLVPNALGTIESFVASTTTPLVTVSDQEGTENPTTITLDADGRPTDPIFVLPTGYKFRVKDSDGNVLYIADTIEDIGATFAANIGALQTEGTKDAAPGYVIVADDRLVTVDTTGSGTNPARIALCAASAFTGILAIKNVGPVNLAIDPNGSDSIDEQASALILTGASGEVTVEGIAPYPVVLLLSDGISNWWVWAISGAIRSEWRVLAATATYTSTTTPATLSGFSWTLGPGTFVFEANLPATMTTTGGLTINFLLTTATLTSIQYQTYASTAVDNATAVSTQGTTATSGTKVFDSKTAAYTLVAIRGSMVVATGGVFAWQGCQNTSAGGGDVSAVLLGASAFVQRVA